MHAQSSFPAGLSRDDLFSGLFLPGLVNLCTTDAGQVNLRRLTLSLYVLGQSRLDLIADLYKEASNPSRWLAQSQEFGMLPDICIGQAYALDSQRLACDLI